jgi:acetyl esterase/lipase
MSLLHTDRKPGTPTDRMQQVLDEMAHLGAKPFELLTPAYSSDNSLEKAKPVVVYWHGGGWVFADLDVYDATPRALAKATGALVISCHYRQAPEHKFPAAHEDAWAAYQWLLRNVQRFGGDPARVAVMGESAGGNLAANVALWAREEGDQAPLHQVLVYPVASNDLESPSYVANAHARPLSKAGMAWFVKHVFASEAETADPRINLVAADLRELSPTTIVAAEIDPLLSDSERLADRLREAGVEVDLRRYDGVTHEFFGMGPWLPEAKAAEAHVAARLKVAFGTGGVIDKLKNAAS